MTKFYLTLAAGEIGPWLSDQFIYKLLQGPQLSQSKQNLASPDLASNLLCFLQNREVVPSWHWNLWVFRAILSCPSHRLALLEFPFPIGKMGLKGFWVMVRWGQPTGVTAGVTPSSPYPQKCAQVLHCPSPEKKCSRCLIQTPRLPFRASISFHVPDEQ